MTRHTVPAEAAQGDPVMHMGPDESVLILIKHCREMKQQETCLRLITLLLLLSCMGLFLFTAADLRKYANSGSSGQESTVQQRPAYSKQDRQCIGEDTSTSLQRPYIHLRAKYINKSDRQYMKWDVEFGETYNEQRRAIEILENGVYFVYVEIALSCNSENEEAIFKKFSAQLHKWNEGYNKTVTLTKHRDGLACTPLGFRSVFVGRIFEMSQGDHVSVWIAEGFNLIETSTFGAYLVSRL